MPRIAGERLREAEQLINSLRAARVNLERLYIDPLVMSIGSAQEQAQAVIETVQEIKWRWGNLGVKTSVGLTQAALDAGLDPEKIFKEALILAMDIVGEEYEQGKRYVPEMLVSAEGMKEAMKKLRPLLTKSKIEPSGMVVIGTVEGDLHDIGKNLVAMMLESAGFEVYDLGIDILAKEFVEAAKEKGADIVGISALLTTTMVYMPEVIRALKESGLRDKVKVMIGGAPITQKYADEIGADGYASDAASAARLAKRLVGEE